MCNGWVQTVILTDNIEIHWCNRLNLYTLQPQTIKYINRQGIYYKLKSVRVKVE